MLTQLADGVLIDAGIMSEEMECLAKDLGDAPRYGTWGSSPPSDTANR